VQVPNIYEACTDSIDCALFAASDATDDHDGEDAVMSNDVKRDHRGCHSVIGILVGKSKGRVAGRVIVITLGALTVLAAPNARAADDVSLSRAKKCMNCHAIAEKLVGPAFKAVAARYANDKDAEARLAKKIREGGSGSWGVVPMPTNDVTPAEATQLAHWVLMQK
jgi:cytochrome c